MTQAEYSGAPGAKAHAANVCKTPHLIRPGLYAFWYGAPENLRRFIAENINERWNSVEEFTQWLTGVDASNELPNHILLFWWIIAFWEEDD